MPEPITFYNRYTRRLETEEIYGEAFLRWAYERPLGRAVTALLVKRAFFSRWYGFRMSRPASRQRVVPFIQKYGISEKEMADIPGSFASFNEFFARKLKPAARPIASEDDSVVFPADGRHFAVPDISSNDGLFVKGIPFDLPALLGDQARAEKFARGSLLISRLCPVDYHRFHFPLGGVPGPSRLINGPLYSVSPIALRQRPTLLWENKRYLTALETKDLGEVLILEIGATCVGSVHQTYLPSRAVAKGEEKGFFTFGGSCVTTIFEPGRIRFSDDLLEQSAGRLEVYARMGDEMGRRR